MTPVPPLYKLDIERYTRWYYNLSLAIFLLPLTHSRRNRYLLTGYRLDTRKTLEPANIKSAALAEHFKERAQKIAEEIAALDAYTFGLEYKAPEHVDAYVWNDYLSTHPSAYWYLPTLNEWQVINQLRQSALETDLENYTEALQKTPLEEKDFARRELDRVEREHRPDWIEETFTGHPVYKKTGLSSFAIGCAFIDYSRFLQGRILELEAAPTLAAASSVSPYNVQWQGSAMELFTLFADLKETGLISGTFADMARIICDNFRNKNGEPFNFRNVQNKLSGTERSKKRVDFSPLL